MRHRVLLSLAPHAHWFNMDRNTKLDKACSAWLWLLIYDWTVTVSKAGLSLWHNSFMIIQFCLHQIIQMPSAWHMGGKFDALDDVFTCYQT